MSLRPFRIEVPDAVLADLKTGQARRFGRVSGWTTPDPVLDRWPGLKRISLTQEDRP